jgi:hypothetical protein
LIGAATGLRLGGSAASGAIFEGLARADPISPLPDGIRPTIVGERAIHDDDGPGVHRTMGGTHSAPGALLFALTRRMLRSRAAVDRSAGRRLDDRKERSPRPSVG